MSKSKGNYSKVDSWPAYRRNEDGTLERATLWLFDGKPNVNANTPLEETGEKVVLKGWEHAEAVVYRTAAGVEYLLPTENPEVQEAVQ